MRAASRTSLLRNAFFLLVRSFANASLGFVFWIAVARTYAVADVGVAAALLSAILLLARGAALGMPMGILRFLPSEPDKPKLINAALTVSTISSLAVGGAFLLSVHLWSPDLAIARSDAALALVVLLSVVFFTLDGVVDNAFVAVRHARYGLVRTSIFYGLRIPLAVAFASLFVVGIALAWTLSLVVSVLGAALLFPRFFPGYRPGLALRPIRSTGMIRFSLWNYATGLVAAASGLLLPLLILVRLGPEGKETSAHFYSAFALASLLYAIPQAFSTQLLVEGSHEDVEFVKEKRRTLRYSGPLLAAGMAGAILLGEPILGLFGRSYAAEAYGALVLLVLASPLILVTGIFSSELSVRKRMRPIFALTSLSTAFTLGVAWFAMPDYGILGVAAGVVAGQAVKLLLYVSASQRVRRTTA
jgi:O-antigen/teichoic acid export membrane protein